MPRPTVASPRALLAVVATTGLLAAPLVPTSPATANEEQTTAERRRPTVIAVDADRRYGLVSELLLGVNHRYTRNGFGLWNVAAAPAGEPDPRVVRYMRRAGIASLRFPGGTTATMYEWERAIGEDRSCQIEGHGNAVDGFGAVREKLGYGPDEFMEVIDATGARPSIMAPFVNGSPREAANWVEYMNDPVGGRNPGGGRELARVRKSNGHRAPYDIRTWEVGNESHVVPSRYLFAPGRKGAEQYAFGGRRDAEGEALGRNCRHPGDGLPSNGRQGQVFEAVYAPAELEQLTVKDRRWTPVSEKELYRARPRQQVFAWDQRTGRATFGTGRVNRSGDWVGNGRIPPEGATVRAWYVNRFDGYFDYARAMSRTDPDIRVCATWGSPLWFDVVRSRDYDCLSAHPITNFGNTRRWRSKVAGHDRMMLGTSAERRHLKTMQRLMPGRTPLLVTEFQAIKGWDDPYKSWSASMSNGVYMASQWAMFMEQGVRYAQGGDLLGHGPGSVFGRPTENAYSVEANVRQGISPMLHAGGRVTDSRVRLNPVRDPDLRGAGTYRALQVASTRVGNRQLWVLVVNRHPKRDVKAKVRLDGFSTAGKMVVRKVVGKHFSSWNPAGEPQRVRLATGKRRVGKHGFTATFRAHSVSVLRLRHR